MKSITNYELRQFANVILIQYSIIGVRFISFVKNYIMAFKVRVDKWLWAVRIFKSRTLATDTVKGNKVKVNDVGVKPSYLLTENDIITVKKEGFNFSFKVLTVIEKRVGAPIAVTCYADVTPDEEKYKFAAWFNNKTGNENRERGEGRPTKRDRREIDVHKDFFFDFDDDVDSDD